MKTSLGAIVLAASLALPAAAAGDTPGDFDHYVLALSWSPSWCWAEGYARDDPQCAPGRRHGFVLHGLWPQQARGWPEFCRTPARDPSRAETAAMADLFGSAGAARHQWNKHGRCSGLGPAAYFDLAREAFVSVGRPALLRRLEGAVRIDPDVVEEAFLEADGDLGGDGVVVLCRGGLIREVRVCLTRELVPRPCGADVQDGACRARDALLPPVR